MVKVKVEREDQTKESLAIHLEYVANQIREGFEVGEGWEVTGKEDDEENSSGSEGNDGLENSGSDDEDEEDEE